MENSYFLSDMCRVFYWVWTYSGYSGDLSPKITFEFLNGKENAVLIDVRPEARDCNSFWPFICRAKYANNSGFSIKQSTKFG